jgi:hypothetical protein
MARNLFEDNDINPEDYDEDRNSFISALKKLGKGVGSGAAEGLINMGASVLNAPFHALGREGPGPVPHIDLKQYLEPGLSTDIGHFAGSFLGPGGAAFKALKALNALRRPAGLAGIASDAGRSAAAGYLTGEDSEGDRGLSTALGAALGPSLGATKHAIGEKIAGSAQKAKEAYKGHYGDLFKEATKNGVHHVVVPPVGADNIIKHTTKHYHEYLRKYLDNPTLENAHWAQSELGNFVRKYEKRADLPPSKLKAIKDAQNLRSQLKQGIEDQISANPELAGRYSKLSAGYRKDVAPFENLSAIKKHRAGKISSADLSNALKNNKEFKHAFGDQFPEYGVNDLMAALREKGKSGAKWGALAAIAGATGGTALSHFHSAFKK